VPVLSIAIHIAGPVRLSGLAQFAHRLSTVIVQNLSSGRLASAMEHAPRSWGMLNCFLKALSDRRNNHRTRVALSPPCPQYPWLYGRQCLRTLDYVCVFSRTGQHARLEILQPIYLCDSLCANCASPLSRTGPLCESQSTEPARENQYQNWPEC